MSSMREAFERRYLIPEDAEFNDRFECYRHRNYPSVDHPINEYWEVWVDACEWQFNKEPPR